MEDKEQLWKELKRLNKRCEKIVLGLGACAFAILGLALAIDSPLLFMVFCAMLFVSLGMCIFGIHVDNLLERTKPEREAS